METSTTGHTMETTNKTEVRNGDDNLSLKSSDSQTTSGEYEIVPATRPVDLMPSGATQKPGVTSPILNLPNRENMEDLEKKLTEVIFEQETATLSDTTPTTTQKSITQKPMAGETATRSPSSTLMTPDLNKVGQSVFYDCLDMSPLTEKQDDMKPEKSDTEEDMSDIDQECTVFSGVTYLGAANINSPKSEPEIYRTMDELNSISGLAGLKVAVSIPTSSEGLVVLYDAGTNAVVAHYEINRIRYFAYGLPNSSSEACFAFTWSHSESLAAIYQCHVFRCSIPEAVTQVNACFIRAFQRIPAGMQSSMTGSVTSAIIDTTTQNLMMTSVTSDITGNPLSTAMYEFNVSLEVREKVTKNTSAAVPRDRGHFKLRCNTDKEVCIVVKQIQSEFLPPLFIERCFGVLLSPGRLVRQADMQLLDMVSMGYVKPNPEQAPSSSHMLTPQHLAAAHAAYQIRVEWKANEKGLEQLNAESPKMYVTVAVDLVIKGIQEPVRFVIETQAMILAQNESRIMDNLFSNKRPLMLKYYLQLKESGEGNWKVQSIDHSDEITEPVQPSLINMKIETLKKMVRSNSAVDDSEFDDLSPTDYSSDGDEPMLSGTGEVSKDCSQDRLEEWSTVLLEWENTGKRPKSLNYYVRLGIPEALRCKVWQKLANVEQKTDMSDRYRLLITKETNCESVILRDINRTFPAHKFFKETGGLGQDGLYKVSKAYAVFDSEVGYCQGLSFIAASLLLHMPEEEAFCCLVALMYDYGLRDMYKMGFESLYLRLYQLDRLMKDQLPDLYDHFQRAGVETHMFASQWFLTLYTARFPLFFVYHILDVFLLDGLNTLFQVGMTLLYVCKKDLLELDFEGILKYFRVMVPKKCRNEQQAQKLMKLACEWKIKKLKKYEDEYTVKKEEKERIQQAAKQYEVQFNEEKKVLLGEITHLHEKLAKASLAEQTSASIIGDYKQIIQRHEQQTGKLNEMLEEITKTIANCTKCAASIPPGSPLHKSIAHFSPAHKAAAQQQLTAADADSSSLGPLDPLYIAQQRIRELELELARTKLEKVQAECHNQDLNHQLNTTMTEIQNRNNANSWQPPWFSKTLNSIQEKVAHQSSRQRETPTFQSYMSVATPAVDLVPKVKANNLSNNKKYLEHRHSLNQ